MLDIVLYQPEIPPNTGNIVRTCAATGARLHLVKPLGFRVDDRSLARAGLDYHELATMQVHEGWPELLAALPRVRMLAFTTKAGTRYDEVRYQPGDALLFGPETRGLPVEMLAALPDRQRLRIPMLPGRRSLNLSNCVAVAVFEAWRQLGFEGGS